MITFKGELKDYVKTFNGGYIITITTNNEEIPTEELNTLVTAKNGLKISMCSWREQRSLNANNYCWKLLDEIAKKIKSTKEQIYKSIIIKVGVFEIIPIRNDALQSFIKRWQSKGLGWICEVQRDSTIPNYTVVVAYYGTSTYNTEEMSRFIDEVVFEARELLIPTETPEQIAEMKSLWEAQNGKLTT